MNTFSPPPGQYYDNTLLSDFTLQNDQELQGEDVFTLDTIGVQPAVLHFSDRSHLAITNERPPVS